MQQLSQTMTKLRNLMKRNIEEIIISLEKRDEILKKWEINYKNRVL